MDALSIVTSDITYEQYVDRSDAVGIPPEDRDIFDAIQTSLKSLTPLIGESYDEYLARAADSKATQLSHAEFDAAQLFWGAIEAMQPNLESRFLNISDFIDEGTQEITKDLKKLREL